MAEWSQFIDSITEPKNQEKAYLIMGGSDLSIWNRHAVFDGAVIDAYPTYDIGY